MGSTTWTYEQLGSLAARRLAIRKAQHEVNSILGSGGEITKLESSSSNGDLGKVQVQKPDPRSFLVIVTSFRRRLLDEDNLCEKYHVDCCRYSGLLSGDGPSQTQIHVRQQKVGSKDREFVRIEIHQVKEPPHDNGTSAIGNEGCDQSGNG